MEKELMLFLVFVLGMITLGYYVSLPHLSGRIAEMAVSQDIHTMSNSLDAAKSYSSAALRFSLYQACYDTLGGGPGDFENRLEASITQYLKAYTQDPYLFLDFYQVTFPTYRVNIAGKSAGNLTVTAKGGNLVFHKSLVNMTVHLEKDSGLEETAETNCWGIYQKGLELAKNPDAARKAHEDAVQGLPENGSALLVLENVQSTTQDELCSRVFQAGNDLSGTTAAIESGIKGSDTLRLSGQDGSLSFSAGVSSAVASVGGTAVLEEEGDGYRVNCTFTYNTTVMMEYWVNDTSTTHPVWNGTDLAFEPLRLHFSEEHKLP